MKKLIFGICGIMLMVSFIAILGIVGGLERDTLTMNEAIQWSSIALICLILATIGVNITNDEKSYK